MSDVVPEPAGRAQRAGDDTVVRAAQALRAGEPIVVHDDRLCVVAIAAAAVDADVIADFARNARGVVAVAMAPERIDALGLRSLGAAPDARTPDYTVTVDAIQGTTTGISASDRAITVQALRAKAPDGRLSVPGHILPVRAAKGGTFTRVGITEACVDLAAIADAEPVVATCELLDDRGDAVAPDDLGAHPAYAGLIAISARAVRAHRRGLPDVATADVGVFRSAMSALVAGVAAITVKDASGAPRGMLATSLSSYSDAPPSMLVSAAHSSRTHDPLVGAAGFGIHLLGHEQMDVAGILAGKSDDKFAALDWSWDGDVPHLDGALGYLRCSRSACFERYDHTIVIGDVELIELDDRFPLVYFQRTLGWQLEHHATTA